MSWPPTQEMVVQFSLSTARGPWSSGDATVYTGGRAVPGMCLQVMTEHNLKAEVLPSSGHAP